MTTKTRWSLRHLFAITTVLALFFGLNSYLKIDLRDSVPLAAAMVFLLTVLFERRMPQAMSLIIAAICFLAIVATSVL